MRVRPALASGREVALVYSLPRVLQVLGVNAVPVLGVLVGGWSTATALVLYWFENLLSTLLVALRVVRHRRLTRKRGHWMATLSATSNRARGGAGKKSEAKPDFLRDFLGISLIFTLAHGVFLGAIVFLMLPESYPEAAIVDVTALWHGLLVVAGFLVVGTLMDLTGIADRPFSWVKGMADRVLGRVVVHLTIVLGMWTMAWLDGPRGLFLVFAAFKTLVDVSTLATSPSEVAPEKPPGWIVAIIRRFGGEAKAAEFRTFYRQSRAEDIDDRRRWEESI